jgi:hypothetical protein
VKGGDKAFEKKTIIKKLKVSTIKSLSMPSSSAYIMNSSPLYSIPLVRT